MTMTRRGHLGALTAAFSLAGAGRVLAADPPVYGTWTGILELGNTQLTLQFIVGAKGVEVISVDQGGARIAGGDVVAEGTRLSVSFKQISATFEGSLTDSRHIDGVFTQGGRPTTIRLTQGEVAEPAPEQPSPPLTAELLEAKRQAATTPAIGAAWARGNHSSLLVAGWRSSETKVAVTTKDQWHWGSITKSMTATLCGRLVEAGVVRWDIKVGQVLDAEGYAVPQAYRDATLLHLLSHRAGLQPNITQAQTATFTLRDLPDARAERLRYAKAALDQKPVGALGAQYAYSNNGYVIVGAMLEAITGKSWEVLIRKDVFAPLGLQRAGVGAPGSPGRIDQPIGHLVTNGVRVPHPPGGLDDDNVVAMGPAGRVHMPLADMLAYLSAHRDRPEKFLKAATWDKLHTPQFGGAYALGWFTRKDGRLWHGGSNTLWWAEVVVDRKTGAAYAVCANDAASATQAAVAEVLMSTRAAALR